MFVSAIKYKSWADRRTLDAVREIDESNFPRSFAFALQQLNHMIRVEELFRSRVLGIQPPHTSTNTDAVPSIGELDRRLTESNQWLALFVSEPSSESLSEVVKFVFVDGKSGCLSRQEILFHLVNHCTYHRGAIGHALDLAGAIRPADTYTVYIHAAEPLRRE